MNEHLHIGIENPSSSRKALLGINLDVMNLIGHFENMKKIKLKKTIQVNKLRILTKRAANSIKELKDSLPSDKEPAFLKKDAMDKKSSFIKERKIKSDINTDKWQDELRKLKEKISKL